MANQASSLPNRTLLQLWLLLFAFTALTLHAQSDAVFLGTAPNTVANGPNTVSGSAAFGYDLDRNYYFLDANRQKIIQRSASGVEATILDGLSNATLAVNWRGDLLVGDPGHHRLIFQQRNPSKTRSIPLLPGQTPKGVLFGKEERLFYLGGSSLYALDSQLPISTPLAQISDAIALASGPDTPQGHTVYILCGYPGAYRMAIYTYQTSGGTLAANSPSVPVSDTIDALQVDPYGNYLLRISNGNVLLISKSGNSYVLGTTAASHLGLAMDWRNKFDFIDNSGVEEIQFGPIDVGGGYLDSHEHEYGGGTIRFAAPPGSDALAKLQLHITEQYYLLPSPDSGGNPNLPCSQVAQGDVCEVFVGIHYTSPGIGFGTLTSEVGSFPVYSTILGSSIRPILENGPTINWRWIPNVDHPTYLVAQDSGAIAYVADASSGFVMKIQDQAEVLATGLYNIDGLAVDSNANLYVIRSDQAGVLKIAPDGAQTTLASTLKRPSGVTSDRWGNIYVGNQSGEIYKIWAFDGEITPYAKVGLIASVRLLTALAADKADNVYASFSEGGSSGHGGLFKISPGGSLSEIAASYSRIFSLSTDLGGGLYLSDSGNKTVSLITTSGRQITLLSGLESPTGIAASVNGLYAVADQGAGMLRTISSPEWGYDFGDVPVETTRYGSRMIQNSGTQGATVFPINDWGDNPAFGYGSAWASAGDVGMLSYSFTPPNVGGASFYIPLAISDYHPLYPSYGAALFGNGVEVTR